MTDKDAAEDALAAAVQNAALEGIVIPDDEQDLIRQHQSGAHPGPRSHRGAVSPIPAEVLGEFNRNIVGEIRVVDRFSPDDTAS